MADESGGGRGGGGGFFGREVFGGKLWSLVAAVVVVVGVVAGVMAIVATRSSSTAKSHPAVAAGGCQLASVVSDTIPSNAPAQTTWIDVRGFKLPVTADGPANHGQDGNWSCYAHTPTGGLEAVVGLAAAALTGNRAAVTSALAPNSVSAAQLDTLAPAGGAQRQPGVAIVGFQFGPFSRQGGQVTLVESCTIASCVSPFYASEYTLTWAGQPSHWLITNGGGNTTPLSSVAGVTTWAAP